MTSLKQFMAWVTASSRIPNQILKDPRWRLLFAYSVAMTAIFGISASVVYIFFRQTHNQQLNSNLLTLVQAAAPSLETIKTKGEGRAVLDKGLPWRNLFSSQEQSLEWFNSDGKLLSQEGNSFPKIPLAKKPLSSFSGESSPIFQHQGDLRIVTIAVYANHLNGKMLQLEGYLRASQSTVRFDANLAQLRLGLGFGGIIAVFLAGISSFYLTRQAIQPMQESFQRLTQFAADASHELRNPLSRISIATEIMLGHEERLETTDVKKLEIIITATEQMRRLIDDVLFLARTNVVQIPRQEQEENIVVLDQLLESLADRFEPQAEIKDINFQVKLQPNLSIKGQTNELERLFSNLLENAIKYTLVGGKVTLLMKQSRQNAIVSVEDTGIGIPSEYLPFVFQRFWRSDQARSQEQDGFGLGLSIAQVIAKQYGGEITVISKFGVGSCFQVRLPLA